MHLVSEQTVYKVDLEEQCSPAIRGPMRIRRPFWGMMQLEACVTLSAALRHQVHRYAVCQAASPQTKSNTPAHEDGKKRVAQVAKCQENLDTTQIIRAQKIET